MTNRSLPPALLRDSWHGSLARHGWPLDLAPNGGIRTAASAGTRWGTRPDASPETGLRLHELLDIALGRRPHSPTAKDYDVTLVCLAGRFKLLL